MKKIKSIFAVLLCFNLLFSINSFAQSVESVESIETGDSVYFIKEIDTLSGKVWTHSNRPFTISEGKSKFLAFYQIIEHDYGRGRRFKHVQLIGQMINIGNCNEDDEIIILFDNGEKIIKDTQSRFNCQGVVSFTFSGNEINLLRNHAMAKIRITNGRSNDSCTGEVQEKDKKYFIQLYRSLDNGSFPEVRK